MKEILNLNYNGFEIPANLCDVMERNFDRHFATYYQKNKSSLLNTLCDQYGSDKGEITTDGHPYSWPSHSYADFIERLFGHCRHYVKAVFECGLGTNNPNLASSMGVNGKPGASHRMWRDYFPNAQIVGADIDRAVLFEEDRIETYPCDQTNADSIAAMWRQCNVDEFDLMIDDGLHTFEAGACLFSNSFQKLKNGGLYIIEDVNVYNLIEFKNFLGGKGLNYDLVNLYRKGLSLGDNSLVVIRK